ncbi:hypothetical protein AB0A63_19535 [Lentzea sp. NPDC042327]|uniref:hypothetical protein n=1 Tax=Lentzea sp. NPDC042327 TaxID=3154801 RepID=UPI0033CEEE46
MTGTPIFDELYAKYVTGAPRAGAAVAERPVLPPPATARDERQHPPAAQHHHAAKHEAFVWPS